MVDPVLACEGLTRRFPSGTALDGLTLDARPGEVLALLGPPSQVISLEEETVLYYLFEKSKGNGLILILYNRMQIDTHFDRAIFFFNDQDILTDYATRIDEPAQG